MADAINEVTSDLEGWHRRLLPFMMGSLIVMGLLFFVLTVWQFRELESRLSIASIDLDRALQSMQRTSLTDATYRDWYVRTILEEAALRHRYQQNSAIVHTRAWTRYMGFLTGMVLALTGCVFVLGKLHEEVSVSGKAHGIEANLTTASPGIALAFAGTVLVGISLWVPVTIESNDVPVYLPRQIELVQTGSEPGRPAPAQMEPTQAGDAARKAPPLPPSVIKQLEEAAGAKKSGPTVR